MRPNCMHVRIDDDTRAALDRLAKIRRLTRSDVLRSLIHEADDKPIHRVMRDFGVSKNEARAFLESAR